MRQALLALVNNDGTGDAGRTYYYYGPTNSSGGEWGAVGEDGGFLGYMEVRVNYMDTDATTVLMRERYYSYMEGAGESRANPDPRQGKIHRKEIWNLADTAVSSSTQYNWNAYWFLDGAWNLTTPRTDTWQQVNGSPDFPPTWIRLESQIETTGATVKVTRYGYSSETTMHTQFGNVIAVDEDSDTDVTNYLRRTETLYTPNKANDAVPGYIVNLPSRVTVYNAAKTCVAETRSVYGKGQESGNFTTVPTTAHLVRSEQLLSRTDACTAYAAIGLRDTKWATTQYIYDAWGNQIEVRKIGAAAADDVKFQTIYDGKYHVFPIEQYYAAAASYKETARYYGVNGGAYSVAGGAWGQMQDWCGVNSVCTWQAYDELGRKIGRWNNRAGAMPTAIPGIASADTRWYYYAPKATGTAQKAFVVTEWSMPRCAGNFTRSHYNGFGELVATQTPYQDWVEPGVDGSVCSGTSGGQEIHTYYRYDGLGRQTGASIPVLKPRSAWTTVPATSWPGGTTNTYDALGRVSITTGPDNIAHNNAYNQYATYMTSYSYANLGGTDGQRMSGWTMQNLLGQTTEVRNYNRSDGTWVLNGRVTLGYDALDNLTSVAHAGGGTSTFTYDKGSRKVGMSEADMGGWSYGYDRIGRLIRQVDARGMVTCLYYDSLERLRAKDYLSGSAACPAAAADPAVDGERYSFGVEAGTGAFGQLTTVKQYVAGVNLVTRTYGYNPKGQVTSEGSWASGIGSTRTLQYGYDVMGRRNSVTYPDGEQVITYYNGMGLPARLTSIVGSSVTEVVRGPVTTATGPSVSYDVFGRMTQMSMLGTATWRTVSYYAPTGQGANSGRLKSIQVGASAGAENLVAMDYVWNAMGDLTKLTDVTTDFNNTYDHQSRVLTGLGRSFTWQSDGRYSAFEGRAVTYPTNKQAMTAIAGGGVFAYDANGNMTSRKTSTSAAQQTLTWSKENRLEKVAIAGGVTESYLYDHTGQRVRSIVSGGDKRYFVFPELEVKIVPSGVTSETKYYFFGGQRVAMRVNNGTYTYLHGDHLGSTVTTTSGTTYIQERYHAYGATRSGGITATDYQYTGQFSDNVTGLIYMNARYYDPTIGQFISPDTIVPDPANLFDYNRYMYTRGNPLKYNDPSGHEPIITDPDFYPCSYTVCSWNNFSFQWEAVWAPEGGVGRNLRSAEQLNEDVAVIGFLFSIVDPGFVDGLQAADHALNGEWGGAALAAAAFLPLGDLLKLGKLGKAIPPIHMDNAVEAAVEFAGDAGKMIETPGGNYQFVGDAVDELGNRTTKIGRIDVNPADDHVLNQGPHLNLEHQARGKSYNYHYPIDPSTIRRSDHP